MSIVSSNGVGEGGDAYGDGVVGGVPVVDGSDSIEGVPFVEAIPVVAAARCVARVDRGGVGALAQPVGATR